MVEFGLKLADNKVEEWAAAYIDYEGLKKLIAAAQRAEKARNDLEARNASLAADIKASYYQTQAEEARLVGFDSDLSLEGADEASETVSLLSFPPEGNGGASNHYGGMGMGTGLSSFSNHGSLSLNGSSNHLPVNNASSSHLNGMGMKRTSSETSLTSLSVIDNVTKTFTGYFQRSSYKHKMIKAIRAEDEAIQAFHKRIHEEARITIFTSIEFAFDTHESNLCLLFYFKNYIIFGHTYNVQLTMYNNMHQYID